MPHLRIFNKTYTLRELTYRQFTALQEAGDEPEQLVQQFLDIPPGMARLLTEAQLLQIVQAIQECLSDVPTPEPLRGQLHFRAEPFQGPTHITEGTYGQFMDAVTLLGQARSAAEELLKITAVYLYPVISNTPYRYEGAERYIELLKDVCYRELVGLGTQFIQQLNELMARRKQELEVPLSPEAERAQRDTRSGKSEWEAAPQLAWFAHLYELADRRPERMEVIRKLNYREVYLAELTRVKQARIEQRLLQANSR